MRQHPLVTFWRRLTRDLREHRKPPLILLRRGLDLMRAQQRVVDHAVELGCTPVSPDGAFQPHRGARDPPCLSSTALVQPDRRSCAAACLVVARMLVDQAYAEELVRAGPRPVPRRGARDAPPGHRSPRLLGRLAAAVAAEVRHPPWAVAREVGGRVSWIRTHPGAGFEAVLAAVGAGHAVPVYVGSRWIPRHVVLALETAAEGAAFRCYEPAHGRVVVVDRAAFADGRLRLAGWDRAWCAVLPAAEAGPTHRDAKRPGPRGDRAVGDVRQIS